MDQKHKAHGCTSLEVIRCGDVKHDSFWNVVDQHGKEVEQGGCFGGGVSLPYEVAMTRARQILGDSEHNLLENPEEDVPEGEGS